MAKSKASLTSSRTPAAARARAPTVDAADVRGELRQLAAIRARFPALAPDTAAALHAHHDDDACRARGVATRAADTFRGAMLWARTFGAHAGDAALDPARVRWFLDCLTALGTVLTGQGAAANPSQASAFEDAAQAAEKALRRVERRARDAVGSAKAPSAELDAALTPDGVLDPRISRLRQLAALLTAWLAKPANRSPPIRVFGLNDATVSALEDAARALDDAIARREAPQQADRDAPAVNAAEGRLHFAMRPLWDDLAEAREDGVTGLLLTVSPTILRALNIRPDRKKAPTSPK